MKLRENDFFLLHFLDKKKTLECCKPTYFRLVRYSDNFFLGFSWIEIYFSVEEGGPTAGPNF